MMMLRMLPTMSATAKERVAIGQDKARRSESYRSIVTLLRWTRRSKVDHDLAAGILGP
jgi:hypothetical protein